ncbi:hypothetical protein C8R46DRAFT_1186758 [Mycena filopes]|nr:hypothetical protein C8R46DRAFT_1186758 [Mycena filopes]
MPVLPISALLRTSESSADTESEATATESILDPEEIDLPPDWTRHVHLNGGLYYSYDHHRLLTTDNICDPLVCNRVLAAYRAAGACFRTSIVDLEMSVSNVDGATFASWSRCRVYAHLNNTLSVNRTSSFWEHALQFPMHRRFLPTSMETEFLSSLAFGSNEHVLGEQKTTFPFEDAQIERLMRVYHDLRGPPHSVPSLLAPALAFHIARAMVDIDAARRHYNYGTPAARLYRDVAIPPPTRAVRVWDLVLGILLCGTHKNYRVRLEATIPNDVVALPEFRLLMRNMMSEWADSNLVATVLVSVNVSFLAVPDINTLQRSCALVSSLCAMASIVTGLHHVWQHREKTDAEQEAARQYLYYSNLTLTAALLAVPLATLQWSVLSFTLAIAALAIQSTSTSTAPHSHSAAHVLLIVLIALLAALACAVFLFFWRIWAGVPRREMEEGMDPNVVNTPEPARVAVWVGVVKRVFLRRRGGEIEAKSETA